MSNTKIKKVLGLDLGSNSIGWALLETNDGRPHKIIDLGSRIVNKAADVQKRDFISSQLNDTR